MRPRLQILTAALIVAATVAAATAQAASHSDEPPPSSESRVAIIASPTGTAVRNTSTSQTQLTQTGDPASAISVERTNVERTAPPGSGSSSSTREPSFLIRLSIYAVLAISSVTFIVMIYLLAGYKLPQLSLMRFLRKSWEFGGPKGIVNPSGVTSRPSYSEQGMVQGEVPVEFPSETTPSSPLENAIAYLEGLNRTFEVIRDMLTVALQGGELGKLTYQPPVEHPSGDQRLNFSQHNIGISSTDVASIIQQVLNALSSNKKEISGLNYEVSSLNSEKLQLTEKYDRKIRDFEELKASSESQSRELSNKEKQLETSEATLKSLRLELSSGALKLEEEKEKSSKQEVRIQELNTELTSTRAEKELAMQGKLSAEAESRDQARRIVPEFCFSEALAEDYAAIDNASKEGKVAAKYILACLHMLKVASESQTGRLNLPYLIYEGAMDIGRNFVEYYRSAGLSKAEVVKKMGDWEIAINRAVGGAFEVRTPVLNSPVDVSWMQYAPGTTIINDIRVWAVFDGTKRLVKKAQVA